MPLRISQPSIQSLFVEIKAEGCILATATAFVAQTDVGDRFLFTNRHNVTGRDQDTGELLCRHGAVPATVVIHHNARSGIGNFKHVEVPLFSSGQPLWIEHPTHGSKADFVALPIANDPEIELFPYRVRGDTHLNMAPAQRVSVVGFPFGEKTGPSFAVWATGFIASEPEIDHGGRPVFLIDCRTRRGQSGSPVIAFGSKGGVTVHENGTEVANISNSLLGIYSGRINVESDIGVVWKASALVELIRHASLTKGTRHS